ncbi:MAG: alginate export family protein [Planctomycetes bacterium]|nr:alginate export family protein [Planctomycetota bacterium]
MGLCHLLLVCATLRAGAPEPALTFPACLKDIAIGPGSLGLDANLRVRHEFADNVNVRTYGTDEWDDILLSRTQVGLEYRIASDDLGDARLRILGQDSRFWASELDRGEFPTNCPHFDALDLREAFAEWKKIAGTPFGFKAGRQTIAYADKKIFGPGDWGNVGSYWWDAAKVYVDTDPVQVDVLYGQRVESEQTRFNDEHFDFQMMGAYARIKRLPFALDLFYVLRYDDSGEVMGEDGVGDERRHTFGFHADGKSGGFDYRSTAAGQLGRYGEDEILALGFNGRLGYTFDVPWKPRLAPEFSFASGDCNPRDGRHGTFDGVFAGVGTVYGWMNLVSWKNLEDCQLTFSVRPIETLEVLAEYHLFLLAAEKDGWYWCNGRSIRRDSTGGAGRMLGQEIDLVARWKLAAWIEPLLGYSRFFPGAFLRGTPGADDPADWFFLQVTLMF